MQLLAIKCSAETVTSILTSMGVGPHLDPQNQSAGTVSKSLRLLADIYQTQQCTLLRGNVCQKGLTCYFAHGPDQLRSKDDVSRLNNTNFCV